MRTRMRTREEGTEPKEWCQMEVRHPEAQEPRAFLIVNHTCSKSNFALDLKKKMVSSPADNIGQRYVSLLGSASHLQFSV